MAVFLEYCQQLANSCQFTDQAVKSVCLKVPKRENFSLAFFTLSGPIWVCDLGTGKKLIIIN
jgi:hypothetical protein